MAKHPFLDWEGPMAFAHRGGASDNPENTLSAFQHAVDLGYTYLETDVHATSDGVLVAFHDESLDRTTDRSGLIREQPWSEVRRARIDGHERIPLFDDFVEAFPAARLNIDCKHDTALDALVAAIRRHDLIDRCCVGAFSDRRLRRLRRELGDGLCTSMGPGEALWWRLTGGSLGADCAQVPVEMARIPVVTEASVQRSRVPVIVWTIDGPDEMNRLLDLGVDGIMTDRPVVLKDVLLERGVGA